MQIRGYRLADEESAVTAQLGKIAHRMNNSLAYVLTNLTLLVEEVERDVDALSPSRKARYLALSDDAIRGAGRVSQLIRELQVIGWGAEDQEDCLSEDTWDEAGESADILVIDDEEPILTSLRLALQRYRVVAMSDPKAALDWLAEGHTPDLIMCDLIMPHVSGIDVFNHIRDNRPELLGRILFMTGGAFTPQLREFLASVRNPVMHKPFDTKTLRWMVAQQLRHRMDSTVTD